ncbi:outer membrane protein insertion porin family [Paraburkholderia terricola]|uniref:Outer membrane protein assembly factor BamA n=1 Tax=Paraburkholderia terricola TaxID=169427 RepID=A0A1M6Y5J1_9BURK|nr:MULTISPECIES: outer membrane protein assembly factor BamA [Paraburkholderia]AXE92510.1 outer membrane protein assembly factor BamA [Paraburkholderia terricola]MDR6411698.1 outer membrane protein insertion porin family [Paraburkholderia terricola]MDR6484019.1 outer membrane protein insertion porin family [Paraburkholderia terricola]MDR6493961.1 outer membrane protein insertion porin family [Paraburkholderia terricola]SDP33847.1 Beta-barrel assembly machine subunit BamA [Paraburkholderia sedi
MNLQALTSRIAGALSLAGISLSSAPAHAVQPLVVQDIRIEGLKRVEPGTLFAYLPIKKGEMFNDDKASEAIRALYATGFFNDVRISTEGGVVIVYVQERPAFGTIDFAGIHEFDKENLTKALGAVGLSQGRYYDKALVEKAEQELKRQYLTRGFYAAEVVTTITPIDRNRVAVLFSVAEGPSAKIRQINFIGNTVFSTDALRDEMQLSTPNWFSWYTKNDLYAKDKLTGDLEHVRSYYLNRGYLEFNIESTQVSLTPDKKDMYLTVTLHEGEPYTISSIKLAGNLLDREAELMKLVNIKAGERFSAEKLQAATKAVVDRLGEYGYAFATVNALPKIDQQHHTVDLTLQVDPSRRVYVRHVNVVGNTRTRDEVVRREMRQFESSWFDSNRLTLSKERVNRLGYFTDVDVTTIPVEGSPDQVDVDVKVSEKPTGSITLGAGFSSSDKVVLSAGVSQENVFGSGTSLGVSINTAKTYRTLSVTQTDPYFTVDGIKRISDIYYRTSYPLYNYSDTSFRIISVGTDLKFGIPFSEADTVYFGVGFEQDRFNIDSDTPQSYKDYVNEFGRVVNNVPVTVGWARDNRDSALVPSRGYFVQSNGEVGTPAGGTQYYKADVQAQYYYSFSRGFIFGLNLQGGYGNGFAGKAYPIFKNYYSGGIGSVRGYESGSLGPRDKTTDDPIGGSRMVVANVEMTFPLPGSGWDRTLRVFTFLDAGNVWGNEGNSTGANGLRYSYGAGLEWISPIGPLKLSMGFPIVKHANDKYQRFQFQIGTSF